MKFYAALAALVATVAAQDLSGLPSCAQTCVVNGITGTGCALTDFKCVCQSTSFLDSTHVCVEKACSADDMAKTLQFATSFCASQGVTITPPASTPAAQTTSASKSESAPAQSSPAKVTSTSKPASNGTVTTAPPPSQFTGAAGMVGGSWVAAAIGAVAVAAL